MSDGPFIGGRNVNCSSTSFVGDPTRFWYLLVETIKHDEVKTATSCRARPVRGGSD